MPHGSVVPWQAGGPLTGAQGNATACTDVLRLARADSVHGPFAPAELSKTPWWGNALSRPCVEGPTVLSRPTDFLVVYDGYRTDCPLVTQAPCEVLLRRLWRLRRLRRLLLLVVKMDKRVSRSSSQKEMWLPRRECSAL